MTEIPTAAGKLYLATVIDLYSRRLLGAATGLHPDAELACEAIKMAVAARGGAEQIGGVIFHTDSEYVEAGVRGRLDPHGDGRDRMLVPGRSRAS
jgi:transposase InsO family protein